MFDFISDECYDLAELELEKYYLKNNLEANPDEILDTAIECIEQDKLDRKIFSEELIEKYNLMKESDSICKRLVQVYDAMQEFDSEEWE